MNKIIPVLLVVVIAAVGATALVLGSDDGEKEEPLPETGGAIGLVYGNADGNYTIDNTDKRIVQAIIDGEKMFADFPLADANCDGAVDDKDLQMIQDYIDKKPMRINVIESNGKATKVVQVPHPMSNIMVLSGTAMAPLVNVFDIYDRLTGVAYNHIDPIRDAPIDKLLEEKKIIEVDPWGSAASNDLITTSHTKVLVTELHRMYDLDSDENVKVLNELGVDVLRLECKDPELTPVSIAIMGIIYDQPENAMKYQKFCQDVIEEIKETEGDKFGTVTMLGYCGPGFNGPGSPYHTMFTTAGGKNLQMESDYKFFREGDQWIYEDKYNADVFMFSSGTNYADEGMDPSSVARWNTYSNTYTWKNGNVFCFDYNAPQIITVAYMAEAMYPDLFEDGWANKVHQTMIDEFFHTDYQVPDDRFLIKIN